MRCPALLAACLTLSACVYIPSRQKMAEGQPVTPEQAAFLYDQGVTLAQAQERLGPPTLDLRDIQVAVWSWRSSGDVWIFALPAMTTSDADHAYRDYSLMVAYADDGHVLTHLLEKRPSWDTASEQARNWYRRIAPSLPPPSQASGANAYGAILVYLPERACSPGTVDIHLDGQRVAELGHDSAIVTRARAGRHELTARVGTLAFGTPMQVTVDAAHPTYVRICSPGLLFQPWKVTQARSSGQLGGAGIVRVVDQTTAYSEMPQRP